MTLVGLIGVWYPQVYGHGFETVNFTLPCAKDLTFMLLLTLIPLKILASSLTFGSGGAGGLFTPSLMVGALLGGSFGYGVHALLPHVTAEHGAYALGGMGGRAAGIAHAPPTAIIMVFQQADQL